VSAARELSFEVKGTRSENGLLEQSEDGAALLRSADEAEFAPFDIVVVVERKLQFGERYTVVDIKQPFRLNEKVGDTGFTLERVLYGLGIGPQLNHEVIPLDE